MKRNVVTLEASKTPRYFGNHQSEVVHRLIRLTQGDDPRRLLRYYPACGHAFTAVPSAEPLLLFDEIPAERRLCKHCAEQDAPEKTTGAES